MQKYTVRDNDCILSIAKTHGFSWQVLWEHPGNADLRELRKDPNVLIAGDVVVLPDKVDKAESVATQQRHRFQVAASPGHVKLRILIDDQPWAGADYELQFANSTVRKGQLDADGFITESIPPDINEGELSVGPPNERMTWGLRFGGLDPITAPAGVEQRLVQLGFDSQKTLREKVTAFQKKYRLEETGDVNEATRARLRKEYGQ